MDFFWLLCFVFTVNLSSTHSCDPLPIIKGNEGYMPCMYLDIKGIKTIGYGYNMMNKDAPEVFKNIGADFNRFFNGPLTKALTKCNCTAVPCLKENQTDYLLKISVQKAVEDAQSFIEIFSSLCCNVQNAIVDMSYTLGGPSLRQFTTFAKLLNREWWKSASDDLTCSKWCNAPHQDNKRCHRDAAAIAEGCGCTGKYTQTCPTKTTCCSSQETCCKAVFTFKSFITKTFDEVGCCPFSNKATCCNNNKCCREGETCCPAAPEKTTYCCSPDFPHCYPGRRCARDKSTGSKIVPGKEIYNFN